MKQSYTPAEWETMKSLITRLYVNEGQSLEAVVIRLGQEGFYVNQRMVKTRIKTWNLHKKFRLPEMRAAIRLLAEGGFDRTSPQATFLIYGRMVEYSEILRYFRRKGIANPLDWYSGLPEDEQLPSANVMLVTPCSSRDGSSETSSGEDTSDESQQGAASINWALPSPLYSLESAKGDSSGSERGGSQLSHVTPEVQHEAQILVTTILQTPQHATCSRLVFLSHAYCASYSTSNRAFRHIEPTVHHLTTHARFAQHIQDGIALLLRQDCDAAFVDFEAAFALIHRIVMDSHPMAIALLMSVVCDLNSRRLGLRGLILALFRHVKETAELTTEVSDTIAPLFDTLMRTDCDATHLALLVVRRMTDCFAVTEAGSGELDWKWLYLRERLCDCLYYAGCDHERTDSRKALLRAQQEKYGVEARNVLWTLTNVADDCLIIGHSDEARSTYGEVLVRASRLEGYGKAKTRFAALEGLGKCKLQEAGCLQIENIETVRDKIGPPARPLLSEALQFLKEAEAEASVWFENTSRRLQRVRTSIARLENLLGPTCTFEWASSL